MTFALSVKCRKDRPLENSMATVATTWCQGNARFENMTVSTSLHQGEPDQNNALLYIVTVLLVYACSIVILMIKYIRREKVEAEYANYYFEFVSRDKFQEPRYQNLQQVNRVMKYVEVGKAFDGASKTGPNVVVHMIEDKCDISQNDICTQQNDDDASDKKDFTT